MIPYSDLPQDRLNTVDDQIKQILGQVETFYKDTISMFRDTMLHPSVLSALRNRRRSEILLRLYETVNRGVEVLRDSCEQHRLLHPIISHFGRNVTKCFPHCNDEKFFKRILTNELQHQAIEEMIAECLIPSGNPEIAELMAEKFPPGGKRHIYDEILKFEKWNTIVEMILENKIESVILWVAEMRASHPQPPDEDSEIDYLLGEAYFLSLLGEGAHDKALTFAQIELCPLATRLKLDDKLSTIMACMLYDTDELLKNNGRVKISYSEKQKSPYAHYFSSDYRQNLCFVLSNWACERWKIDKCNPLETCLNQGRLAIPQLTKTMEQMTIMSQCTGTTFAPDQEVPMQLTDDMGEYNVLDENEGLVRKPPCNCYHSRFICPILKVQSTRTNPPLRLVCGHVISRDAMSRTLAGSRLKCPYCASEQNPNQAMQIIL